MSFIRRSVLLFSIAFSSGMLCFGQGINIKFKHLRKSDGLSNENITSIYQDQFGFIWIATESGLNLYDGYEVISFLYDNKDTTSISSNFIENITEDSLGNIYVATNNGLNIYNRRKKSFTNLTHDPIDTTSLSHDEIKYVFFDSDDNLWVATRRGLNLAYRGQTSFKHFFHDEDDSTTLALDNIQEIFQDSEGTIWIATFGGLSRLNPDHQSFTNYYHNENDPSSISSNMTTTIFEDSKNNLWVGTLDGGLNLMDKENGTFVAYDNAEKSNSLSSNFVADIVEDNQGNLWIATANGLNIFNIEEGVIKKYFSNSMQAGLISDMVSTIYTTDDNQVIWIGTRFGGVNIIDQKANHIAHFQHSMCFSNTINHSNVSDFAEDDKGNFWVSTDGGGVSFYDRTEGSFRHLLHEPNNSNSLSSDKALAIEVDKYGYVWIGFWDGGLDRYNPATGKFKHYKHIPGDSTSITDDNIFYILEDSDGEIWIATWGNGISEYNWETDDFTTYPYSPNVPDGLHLRQVLSLCEDHLGNIWATSYDNKTSFSKINPETGIVTNYHIGTDSSSSINSNTNTILEDSKHRLWIGTAGNGLMLFDENKGSFTCYTTNDGLSSNSIVGLLEDSHGNLWASTFNGICKFNPDSLTVKNYYESDGLQSNQFNLWAYEKLKSGEMLFGGVNGFNLFHPDSLNLSSPPPDVYITDFRLFNKSVVIGPGEILEQDVMFADKVSLSYNQNFITISYVGLDFSSNEEVHYKYKLEGLQDDWVYVDNERKASYTALDPGSYTFLVTTRNGNGIWNKEVASLSIQISPPFWATWWFRLFLAISAISLLILIYLIRTKNIRRQKIKLEREVTNQTFEIRKKNEILADQTHKLKAANKEIKDSIRAAELIQRSILPTENHIRTILKHSFILYLPKDIVGGDFYWIDEISGKKYLAVVDCAGHGVSGAFMSINAHHIINKVLDSTNRNSGASILNDLNKEVIEEFNNTREAPELVERMDLSLCIIDEDQSALTFAGANLPLYLLRNNEIIQIPGNNLAIGAAFDNDPNPFNEHKVDLQKDDTLYMFSDGYADQIGGEKGQEKFLYHRFRTLITEVGHLELKEQKRIFHERLISWKKDIEQLDDILIVGVKI